MTLIMNDQPFCGLTVWAVSRSGSEQPMTCHPKNISRFPFPAENSLHNQGTHYSCTSGSFSVWQHWGHWSLPELVVKLTVTSTHFIHLLILLSKMQTSDAEGQWAEVERKQARAHRKPALSRHVVLLHSAPLLITLATKCSNNRPHGLFPPHLHVHWRGRENSKLQQAADEANRRLQLPFPHLCHIT